MKNGGGCGCGVLFGEKSDTASTQDTGHRNIERRNTETDRHSMHTPEIKHTSSGYYVIEYRLNTWIFTSLTAANTFVNSQAGKQRMRRVDQDMRWQKWVEWMSPLRRLITFRIHRV